MVISKHEKDYGKKSENDWLSNFRQLLRPCLITNVMSRSPSRYNREVGHAFWGAYGLHTSSPRPEVTPVSPLKEWNLVKRSDTIISRDKKMPIIIIIIICPNVLIYSRMKPSPYIGLNMRVGWIYLMGRVRLNIRAVILLIYLFYLSLQDRVYLLLLVLLRFLCYIYL